MGPAEALRRAIAEGRLQPDPGQARVAERLEMLCTELKNRDEGRRGFFNKPKPSPRGVYLFGGVGAGKSLMMDMFFDTAPVRKKRRVHFHQFMQEIQARITAERARKNAAPMLRVTRALARQTRLLCLDELEITDVGDAMIIGRLFEGLFAESVVMAATSNRHPDDLYRNGLNRQLFLPFINLIKQTLNVVELDSGRDYRLEQLQAAPVCHHPLGPEADAAMDCAFDRLTRGANVQACILMVQGRDLIVPRHAAGVARFTFEQLCAQPLGPADYLMLAGTFHTLMIDGVPLLTLDKRDQAKRFVTLIDALYEVRTKLVMSAAAEPGKLYGTGDYAFEFQRAASRLMEMGGRDYLAAARRPGGARIDRA